MNKREREYSIFEDIILFIGISIAILLLVSNLFFKTNVTQNADEIPMISINLLQAIILLLVSGAVLNGLNRKLKQINSKSFFILCLILQTFAALYLICHVDPMIRADAKAVYDGALDFAMGDYSQLDKGGYFYFYPHQLGLVLYNSCVNLISQNLHVHFIVNYVMLVLVEFLTWKTSEMMFEGKKENVSLIILFMIMFYPALFFILFLYGHIPGYLLVVSSLYFLSRKEKGIGKYNDFAVVLCLIFACTIRNNYAIAAIAVAILYILYMLRDKKKYLLLVAVLILLTFSKGSEMVGNYYQHVSGVEINEGIPKVLWIAMGIQDEDIGYRLGGWYNSYTKKAYSAAKYDEEKATEAGIDNIKERILVFMDEPQDAMIFFGKKIVSTWCDATYQSIWSGPLEDCGQNTHTALLQNIYQGGKIYKLLDIFGRMLTLCIYIGFIAFYVIKRVQREKLLITQYFPIIYLCGGFLFHIFWETKSQYVWTYVYCLIPLAAGGWNRILELIDHKKKSTIVKI